MTRRAPFIQTSFASGELTPLLFARTDLKKYQHGVKTLLNFVVRKHGGVIRRPGTKYAYACKGQAISDASANDNLARLIPFKYSTTQSYALEFGQKDGTAYTLDDVLVANCSYAYFKLNTSHGDVHRTFPVTRTFTVAGCSNGVNNTAFTVQHAYWDGTNTFIVTTAVVADVVAETPGSATLTPDIGYMWVYRDKGILIDAGTSNPVEIDTLWQASMLREIKFVQSADVMYMCHPKVPTQKLARSGADDLSASWTFTRMDQSKVGTVGFKNGPFDPEDDALEGTTLDVTNNPSDITVDSSAAMFADRLVSTAKESSTDWHRLLFIVNNSTSPSSHHGVLWIDEIASTTSVDGHTHAGNSFSDLDWTAADEFRLGMFSNTSGWPHAAVFHNERLWLATTDTRPQTFAASVVGSYRSYREVSHDAGVVTSVHGMLFTISDRQVNEINWLMSDDRGVLAMTDGGIHLLGSGDLEFEIDSLSISAKKQSTIGSHSTVSPHQVGHVILYPQHDGRRVRELVFSFDVDKYVAPDMNLLANHITKSGFLDSAYQQEPDSILWVVRADGYLLGLTYERDEEIVAWHKHTLGGTGVEVESICTVRDGDDDILYLTVKRTINSQTVRYVEYLANPFDIDDDKSDAIISDCTGTYDSTETSTITGLGYLEAESVSCLCTNNAGTTVVETHTVSAAGEITLTQASSTVQVGLFSNGQIDSLPVVVPDSRGETRDLRRAPYKVIAILHNTMTGEGGKDSSNTEAFPSLGGTLYTGTKEILVGTAIDYQPTYTIMHKEPLPMTISGVLVELLLGGS